MRRKNNKGFTMMEILGAIAILGIIMMIAVPGITKLMKRFKNDYYVELEETITATAKDFYSDNKIYRPNGLLKSSSTKVSALVNKNYIDELKDYKGKSCSLDESYIIVVYRGNGKYEYQSCLKCDGDKYESETEGTYCNEAWLTNENIKYDYGESNTVYVYKDARQEEVREKLLKSVNVVKYDNNGEVLDRVLAESTEDNLLPYDIDDLDTSVVNPDTNMKKTILHYKYENQTDELDVVVYKHFKPQVKLYKDNGAGKSVGYIPGTWSNNITIQLFKNQYDEFFELSNTHVKKYQFSINNGEWQDVACSMTINEDGCGFVINKNINANYKFRLVTNEGKLSDESINYPIRVDVDKPTVSINPNGDEPIVAVGSTKGTLEFELTTNDTGGSRIKTRKYAINTSRTDSPSSFTAFNSDTFNYSSEKEGNIYYVWSKVEDNAGNTSTEVWPSNQFKMKYEIIYDANGGEGAPEKTYKEHGNKLMLSSTIPTKEGYTFTGWTTTSGEVEYYAGGAYRENEAAILYAVWRPNKLTVIYNVNGGSTSPNANYNINTTTHKWDYDGGKQDPMNFSSFGLTRTGYSRKDGYEWNTKVDGTGTSFDQDVEYDLIDYSSDIRNGDVTITLYAQWTENKLTVNHYDGDTNKKTEYYYYDNEYPNGLWNYSSLELSKTGYTGTGEWKTSDGSYVVDEDDSFTTGQELALDLGEDLSNGNATVNVYAIWTENKLTVNHYDGDTNKKTEYYYYDNEYPNGLWNYSSLELSKTGYTGTGEWKTSDGSYVVDEDDSFTTGQALAQALGKNLENGNASVDVYAQWERNKCTVTYNANGGSASKTAETVNCGNTVSLPSAQRAGYTFNGWYTASSGGTRKGGSGSSYNVEATITLYAQWTKDEHTHVCEARTSANDKGDTASNVLKFWPVNEHHHWCTNTTETESCIPTNYTGDENIPMYGVTCEVCGESCNGQRWCPVHKGGNKTSGGGGKNIPICDAETKKYSSDATSCYGYRYSYLGWTQVSK